MGMLNTEALVSLGSATAPAPGMLDEGWRSEEAVVCASTTVGVVMTGMGVEANGGRLLTMGVWEILGVADETRVAGMTDGTAVGDYPVGQNP